MKTESPAPVSNGQFGVDIGRTGVVLEALSDIVSGGGDDLYAEEGESYFESVAIPVYADFRLTGGSKRVTPYMGTKVGCDVNGFDLYAGIEFSECVDFEAQTIGLTVGKSF